MKKLISVLALALPSVAFAQTSAITDVNTLSAKLLGIGNLITYILVAAAVLFIVFNVVKYMIKPAGDEGRGAAGMNVLWGIVGLFIIVSIWGLVNILTNTFSTTPTTQAIPNFGQNVYNGGIPANGVPFVQ